MALDEIAFNAHVQSAEFQSGIIKGMWGIVSEGSQCLPWPDVIIWIRAAFKTGKPGRYYFKFNLTGYPENPPTACPWDLEKKSPLSKAERPTGPKFVTSVFHTTFQGGNFLYCPLDREARVQHANWEKDIPDLWWRKGFTILNYLNYIYSLINSNDYASS